MAPTSPLVAIIAGVGAGTGASVARKFAQTYSVVLLARNPANYESLCEEINKSGGKATGISTDLTDEESMKEAFRKIEEEGKGVAAAVFNMSGPFSRKPFLEQSVQEWDKSMGGSRGAFLFSHYTLKLLLKTLESPEPPQYPPTLIFTGATASVKGSSLFGLFAASKFALRALSQSLGREFGPKGIHVAHAIIDGVIDIERTKGYAFKDPDAKISPDAIADAYFYLHTQPRTSFTYEIDMRPYVEKW